MGKRGREKGDKLGWGKGGQIRVGKRVRGEIMGKG